MAEEKAVKVDCGHTKEIESEVGDEPSDRYVKWLEHKKNLEEEIRKFEICKEQFLLRRSGKTGDRPTTDEIRQYENDKGLNDMRCRELMAVENKVKQSFDLTTLLRQWKRVWLS